MKAEITTEEMVEVLRGLVLGMAEGFDKSPNVTFRAVKECGL